MHNWFPLLLSFDFPRSFVCSFEYMTPTFDNDELEKPRERRKGGRRGKRKKGKRGKEGRTSCNNNNNTNEQKRLHLPEIESGDGCPWIAEGAVLWHRCVCAANVAAHGGEPEQHARFTRH